jgi:hypothetical protein
MLREECYRPVEETDGEYTETVPIVLSIIRKTILAPHAGNQKAQQWVFAAVREVESADAKILEQDFKYAQVTRIQSALELAGIQFIVADGVGSVGVRLVQSRKSGNQ